jgi:hypothetical protein
MWQRRSNQKCNTELLSKQGMLLAVEDKRKAKAGFNVARSAHSTELPYASYVRAFKSNM